MLAGRLAQHRGSLHIGVDECQRLHERAVDVRLGGKVDDRVDLRGEGVHERGVADVAVDEPIAGCAIELGQVREVAGVRELVEDRDLDLRPRVP